ncbi:hypothetical protein [Streptomyces sp. NPDC049906]|uniref:hypothetical protein n=1 Tax=Streptomyces sp. NPDC049906 TaxID=3155656 RepID=UPI00343BD68A
MSALRVSFTDVASAGRDALTPGARKEFDAGILAIARDPYGCGSTAVGGDRDRREATVNCVAFVRYEVSVRVVTVTVLRVVPAP